MTKRSRFSPRETRGGASPRVEYEVTGFGRSLEPILKSMQQWGSAFKARRLAEESDGEHSADTA